MADKGSGRTHEPQGMVDDRSYHRHLESGLSVTLSRIPGITSPKLLKKPYRFQVAPLDEFGWDHSYNWIDYDTVTKGQFTRDGGRVLRTLSISSLVVDYNPSWSSIAGGRTHQRGSYSIDGTSRGDAHPLTEVVNPGVNWPEPGGDAPHPANVARDLDTLCDVGEPLNLVVWNRALEMKPDIDMAVTIRTYSVRERGGEPDARYFDLGFTEYRTAMTKRKRYGRDRHEKLPAIVHVMGNGNAFTVEQGGESIPERNQDKIENASLTKLAKAFYGSASEWKIIAARNGIDHWGGDTPLAGWVGQGSHRKLTIPKKSGRD